MRQRPSHKKLLRRLSYVRCGEVTEQDWNEINERAFCNLTDDEKVNFGNENPSLIWLCETWSEANKHNYEVLVKLGAPVAVIPSTGSEILSIIISHLFSTSNKHNVISGNCFLIQLRHIKMYSVCVKYMKSLEAKADKYIFAKLKNELASWKAEFVKSNGLAVPTLSDKKNNGFVSNVMKQLAYIRRLKINWNLQL